MITYKITIIVSIVILATLLVGCLTPGQPSINTTTTPINTTASTVTNGWSESRDNDPNNWILGAKAVFGYTWICPNGHAINTDKKRDWAKCDIDKMVYEVDLNDWVDNRLGKGSTGRTSFILHSGHDTYSEFEIQATVPDNIENGWYKAPMDVVYDWVDVYPSSPYIEPYGEIEVKVVMRIPSKITDEEVEFWSITTSGQDYLDDVVVEKMEEITQELSGERYNEILEELTTASPGRNKDSLEEEANEILLLEIEAALAEYIQDTPEVNVLWYMAKIKSVSVGKFNQDYRQDYERYSVALSDILDRGYVYQGNLMKDNWEVWVNIKDMAQTGFVRTSMNVRFMIVAWI